MSSSNFYWIFIITTISKLIVMTLTSSLNYDCHEDSACISTWIPFSFSRKSLIVHGTHPKEGPEVGADLVHGMYLCASCSVVNTQENEESQQTMADWMPYCSKGIGEQDFSQILGYAC